MTEKRGHILAPYGYQKFMVADLRRQHFSRQHFGAGHFERKKNSSGKSNDIVMSMANFRGALLRGGRILLLELLSKSENKQLNFT